MYPSGLAPTSPNCKRLGLEYAHLEWVAKFDNTLIVAES
jgi:hypothetical protein